jgi:Family of unknown function (DUF6325)
MGDINVDELGPVDYLVVGFPADQANFSGDIASELKALIDGNTVRVLDLVILTKSDDGSVEASERRDADDSAVGELRALERDLAVLLAEQDVERSVHRWSLAVRLRCSSGRTRGRRRSALPFEGQEVSS